MYSSKVDKEDLKVRLTPLQYHVTQSHGTEAPFSNEYCNHKEKGDYLCVVCEEKLFTYQNIKSLILIIYGLFLDQSLNLIQGVVGLHFMNVKK